MPRARARDPRLNKARDDLQAAVGDLMKQLRSQQGMTLIDLGEAIAKVGGQFHWTRPNVLSDVEAGRRPITLEDIVMVARALSTKADKDHGEVHPLQLTPWIGASSKLLTQRQAAEIEVRLMTERVAWREAKLKEVAKEFAELVDDLGFRAAIADLAALSQDDRKVVQRMLRGLLGGAARRPAVEPAKPAASVDGIKDLAAVRRRNAATAAEAYKAAAAAAKKAGRPFRPVDQRATRGKGGPKKP